MDSPSAANAPAPPSKRRTFVARLASTVILWSAMVFAFVSHVEWPFPAITALFGIGTSLEFFRLMRVDPGAAAYRRAGLLLCVLYWAAMIGWILWARGKPLADFRPPWLIDAAALVAAIQIAFILACRGPLEGHDTLRRILFTVFGVAYTAICFGFVLRLIYFDPKTSGMSGEFLMLFLVLVTKLADSGAYAIGVLFGKRKLIPHISPAKSWAGLFGAFLGAFVGASVLLWLAPHHVLPLTWATGLLAAPVLCIVGVIGDLAESVIKRCVHIKDSGHALPGIGGIMDLTDSLLFTAPVFYFYLIAISP